MVQVEWRKSETVRWNIPMLIWLGWGSLSARGWEWVSLGPRVCTTGTSGTRDCRQKKWQVNAVWIFGWPFLMRCGDRHWVRRVYIQCAMCLWWPSYKQRWIRCQEVQDSACGIILTTFLCTEFLELCLEDGVGIAVICVHDVLVAVAQTDRETSTIISVKFTDWLDLWWS